ncbi:TetR/AcrR family transcriptional regulator [Streptomyces uncialis]|uniref:TetR/AcrR family transcriptional regulator n=1 Tax=Streptomyces uncialis TaxID=1048205 RepID=UPI00386714B3|nr:TetR family transcriptional regulator [Streptomyces uncialis]
MTSRDTGTRTRKAPAERRHEIIRAAARVGLAEGLECVTLRRIADELGVQPGLVGHYFPAADTLVADAFTSATMAELDGLLPAAPENPADLERPKDPASPAHPGHPESPAAPKDPAAPADPDRPGHKDPLSTLRRFFTLIASTEFDNVSKLWLNARHLSRYRPVLRDHVIDQELLWCRRIEQLIATGASAGVFRCANPWAAAVRILVAIDGSSAYINTSADTRTAPIADLARTVAETELALPPGSLAAEGTTVPPDTSTGPR